MNELKLQFAHNCVLATAEVDGEQYPLIIPREQYMKQTGMDASIFAEKSYKEECIEMNEIPANIQSLIDARKGVLL
jgi:hypothetical protein